MFGGRKKELGKRVLAFVVALTMVVTLVDMTTVIALAKEETAVEATESSETTVIENVGSIENQVEEEADDVDDTTISDAVENPVEEEPIEEAETEEEETSVIDALEETILDAVQAVTSKDYKDFTENEVVADLAFGTDVKAETIYDEKTKQGFDKIEYPTEATGWSSNVYYPRVAVKTASDSSYVKDAEGSLAISSKVWTETESSGYGVYTYENTSVFQYDTENADYAVEVTFVNPTSSAYSAYVKAENITKVSDIEVAAGKSSTVNFVACLVDGQLSLAFLGSSDAKSEAAAATNTVYVSNVKITRLATNEQYTSEAGVKKPTVYLASDSTVQSYDSYYYPQTGWGQVLAEFFGDGKYQEVTSANCGYSQAKTYETSTTVVENRSIGGRSSYSFIAEGKLDDLLEDIAPGDYLLVQWGHNDSTYSRPNRYVSATADSDKNGVADFEQWMQYYVDAAIQRGATPVLVTPVARYSYTTDSDGNLISYASNFEAYRQVMIKMSKEQGIALVDLTQRSIDIANTFGIDGGKSIWLWTNAGDYTGAYAGGSSDSTHLQWYGAYKFAQAVAQGIVDAGNSQTYTNENNSSSENKKALKDLSTQIDLRAATSAPGAVANLQAGTVGASSISISWDADSNSELYHIYRAEFDSEEAAKDFKFATDATKYSVSRGAKFTDSHCAGGKTYVYAVRGFNSLGLGEFSNYITVTTKSAGLRFDFNYGNSATQYGWIGIKENQLYDKEVGYGWSEKAYPNNGRSRGNNGTVSDDLADMAGDFNLGAGTFCVDLPNGDYEVTVYAADLLSGTSTIKTAYVAEGVSIGGCSCKQSLASVTAQVRVADGQLNLEVGGTNAYINGLTITEILKAPSGLAESEVSVVNGKYTSLLAFNPVDEAAGYNYYIKGTTDASFRLERTFTKETYLEGVTVYGAISVNLGENYEYYVTCYTADGTESAPSNTVVVKALLDVATPYAPANLVCVDPTAQTSEVQNSITIKWDAAEVVDKTYPVIKYIVYRSDKSEDDKGFVEFTKIGETEELTFKDTSEDIATNIAYYYKVCAANAGGAGALSEVCKTPVTGKLVAGNQETLTDRALSAIALSDEVKGYSTSGEEITKGVYLSWRAFEEEFSSTNKLEAKFTVYCNDKVIASGISATNMIYEGGKKGDVFKVVGSDDANVNGGLKVVETKARDNQYIEYSLNKPEDQATPSGEIGKYTANDMSVGDVDGDGVLELIVKWVGIAQDNSKGGYTNTTILDTYDIDWATSKATLLSRIDLGVNIRSGAHYTQFQVWDFDGDGKAEVAVKTADGSTSYNGNLEEVAFVGACSAKDLPVDTVSAKNDYRNSSGYVLSGPEYFSIFNLEDGTKAAEDVAYTPARGNVSAWGDGYGNRVDRFLSATAYLDGVHPFAVMGRGYYTRTAITAYGMKDTDDDKIGDTIYELWAYDTDNGDGPKGQGNHNLSVADVDNDGKDEIVYGSSCYDHDGTLKYSTNLGHGDAMHVSDWISWNPGLEVMEVHEEHNQTYQVEIHDAETGKILIGYPVANSDVGRGVAADIDPTSEGAEFWASKAADGTGTGEWDSVDSAVYGTAKSSTSYWDVLTAGSTPAVNAMIYWDGDLLAEIQDHKFNKGDYVPIGTLIADWDYENGVQETLLYSEEIYTSNGTKGNLGLIADLTGDWREEFIARCSKDDSHVRVYSTTYMTEYVIPCFLDDLQYREGVAWENVAYNQPTHTSYLISKGLVTAEVSGGKLTTDSVELQFTGANDGSLYGHDITGYAIYRNDELIDTVALEDLKTTLSEENGGATKPEEVTRKNYFSFDFGDGEVAEGYTKVTAADAYSAEKGYGFTDLTAAGNTTYGTWADDALLSDSVLFYDKTTTSKEFKVDLPNGTYKLTYTVAGNNYYNAITAEGKSIESNKFRCGRSEATNTVEAEVEVTDGQLNVVATVSKNGYFNIIFTAMTISETDAQLEAREAEYKEALEKYEAQHETDVATAKYVYVDKNLESNTAYSYKVAAVVDGKPSFRSKAATLKTLVKISSIKDFELENIVEGTKVETDATELLPKTAIVIDEKGEEQEAQITWDITGLDINTPGDYTIKATIAGYDQVLDKKVTVVPNQIKKVSEYSAISVIVGSAEIKLPETAEIEYTNGSKDVVEVVWDTTGLDLNTIGEYKLTGTITGYEQTAEVIVKVCDDYPVSVEKSVIEVPVGKNILDYLPATVAAKMASGNVAQVKVTWKTDGVGNIDTSAPSQQIIHGTVEGLDADVLLDVAVTYPLVAKFDFGINAKTNAEGWTVVTVNPKGGKKTNAQLGIEYTEAKGYGFTGADDVIEGRQESIEGGGIYPTNVTTDFALMTGKTFVVDVENGNYVVTVMTTCGIGNTTAIVDVEGITNTFSANKSYTVVDYAVEVTDGQLTITDKSSLARIGAIVVRKSHSHTAGEAVVENKVEATCTKAGSYDSVVYCSACGEEISRQTVEVPADSKIHGETEIKEENRVEPTCEEAGSYDSVTYCKDCGEKVSSETITLDAAGHESSATVVEKALVKKDGRVYTYCTKEDCGKILTDEVISGVKEATLNKYIFAYNRKTHKPVVKVVDMNGNALTEGADFTVEFSGDGKKVGVYKATITLCGNYEGELVEKYYVLTPIIGGIIEIITGSVGNATSAIRMQLQL